MPKTNKTGSTVNFDTTLPLEHDWIAQRRKQVKGNDDGYGAPKDDAVGLGLSGGGIRSAVFNLGLLQALERHNVMSRVDYLSTVSGGGFIGSCFIWLKSLSPKTPPFGTSRSDYSGRAGAVLAWLRSHGKYLIAGDGLSVWSLAAALITAVLANIVAIVPGILLMFYLLTRQLQLPPEIAAPLSPIIDFTQGGDDGFAMMLVLGVACLALFVILMVLYVSTTSLPMCRGVRWQRNMRSLQGKTLMFGVLFVVAGTIPLFHQYMATFEGQMTAGFTESNDSMVFQFLSRFTESTIFVTVLSGVFSLLAARRINQKAEVDSPQGTKLINVGLVLVIYGMFLLFYELMKEPNEVTWTPSLGDYPWFWYTVAFSVFLALFGNVNLVSMHRYYRNRLMEAFMPIVESAEGADKSSKLDRHRIYKKAPNSDAPFHIINATVNMVGSDNPKRQGRGGDNFILSPLFCGAESTGYAPTNQYVGNTMDLATAMAISGAAVDPNSYVTRSRPVSFLMTLLNLRLGYWIRNPKRPASFNGVFSRPWWFFYMLYEILGNGLNEDYRHVHLADGGHFENLGLYELVRRRCRFIIISDAAADPDYGFLDLAKVIEMVRVDFGAKVTLSTDDLVPQGEGRFSEHAFTTGSIEYIDCEEPAKLIYIKTAITKGLSEDIYGYRRANPTYPDESTADQFFDETQFEAYRELGFQIGEALCSEGPHKDIESLFQSVEKITKAHESKTLESGALAP